MKILFLSDLYSTPLAPKRGVANARMLHAMRAHATIRVLCPVPWYPQALARFAPTLKPLIELPQTEPDDDGSPVYHPRRLQLPRSFATQAALYTASLLWPLRAAIRRFEPDVLLSAWAYPDGTATVALGKLLGLPTVVRVMGSDINDYAQRPYRRPQISLAMRNAGRIISVSKPLGRAVEALGVRPERIEVIPTGIDTSRFYPVDRQKAAGELQLSGKPLIMVPSRLSPEKGVHHFIDAMAKLSPQVHAVLVGDGPEEKRLRAQVERLGLSARVHFAGFQPEARMKLYYSAADLVCLSSLEEGWPDVVMESFACGCPVVASDVGGVAEQFALTGSGMLAHPGDVETLSRVLGEALERDWDREQTAERISHHTFARTAERYCETCADAAAEHA